ncbi:MAG TPA: EAL domain-containing protein [Rhodocyclaceae bacterium]|nr:EAL domain-containing protein [Rhodocyclaceae bacterium]
MSGIEEDQDNDEIFLGRQPILDRKHNLYAYELLFRSSSQNSANVEDNMVASTRVISHAFTDLGLEQALGPYKGFINCDETLLLSDILEILPSEKIVLEVLETVKITPAIVERCKELKSRGFMLALDDFVHMEDQFLPLMEFVDVVKVDLPQLKPGELRTIAQKLKNWPVKLLAEKVDSRELANECLELGFTYFQGYYFARPTIVAGRKLGHSQMALMQLLSLVMEDADTSKLESVFKHEPGLTVNLMRLTNSVATGCRVHVTSLRHAISVLGRRQLQRWLQLLLYTTSSSGTMSPLMMMAATRGRLMELLAEKLGNQELVDEAFMTGILSLMPALLSAPMDEILKSINLAPAVHAALQEGKGVLGSLLHLTEALESGDGIAAHGELKNLPGITTAIVNTDMTEALRWANNIDKPNEADD